MGSMSGFPLADALSQSSPPGTVINLSIKESAQHNSVFARLARKFNPNPKLFDLTEGDRLSSESGSIWSKRGHNLLANMLLRKLKNEPKSIVVLTAADDQFCSVFACARPELKKRIFACFHQPPGWFRLHWRTFRDFELLGGIISLSNHQAAYFNSICKAPTFTIKHGVRSDFFIPPFDNLTRSSNRLIFVGQWLRDFDVLTDSMELIWRSRPDVCLDCVVSRKVRDIPSIRRLAIDPRVSWHTGLSDMQLRHLYQVAALLFIPVIDSVANNAVVEALASGLPIVTTDIGGMPEYVPSDVGMLCQPNNPVAHANAVIYLLDNPPKMLVAGAKARERAVSHHDWSSISASLHDWILYHGSD